MSGSLTPGSRLGRAGGPREPFCLSAERKLMAVAVETSTRCEAEAPRPLFDAPLRRLIGIAQYDVAPDGQRFLLNRIVEGGPVPLRLVQNWAADMKKS